MIATTKQSVLPTKISKGSCDNISWISTQLKHDRLLNVTSILCNDSSESESSERYA